MGLVHPSRKREILSVLAVLVLGLGASLFAANRDADARPAHPRPATGAVVPDGTYGGLDRGSGEYVIFKVRNRRVRDLAFNTRILCQASDSTATEPRFFSASHGPQGTLISAQREAPPRMAGAGRRSSRQHRRHPPLRYPRLRRSQRDRAGRTGAVRSRRSEGELRRWRHRQLPPRLRSAGALGLTRSCCRSASFRCGRLRGSPAALRFRSSSCRSGRGCSCG